MNGLTEYDPEALKSYNLSILMGFVKVRQALCARSA